MPQEKGLRGMPTKKEGSLPDSFQVNCQCTCSNLQSALKMLNQTCVSKGWTLLYDWSTQRSFREASTLWKVLVRDFNAGTHFLCLLTHHHQINHYWYTLNGRMHLFGGGFLRWSPRTQSSDEIISSQLKRLLSLSDIFYFYLGIAWNTSTEWHWTRASFKCAYMHILRDEHLHPTRERNRVVV